MTTFFVDSVFFIQRVTLFLTVNIEHERGRGGGSKDNIIAIIILLTFYMPSDKLATFTKYAVRTNNEHWTIGRSGAG